MTESKLPADIVVSGFTEIVISVDDIAKLRDALVKVANWSVAALPDAPREQFAAWHVPASCTRIEQVLLTAENDTDGRVRLVKFHGTDGVVMRSSQRTWDTGGVFDFDVYVNDVDSQYREFQRHGWTAFGEPVDYSWGGFEVRQSLALSPDGIAIGMLQPYGKVLIDLPEYQFMSRAFNSAQIVRDFDASLAFYQDKLGWQVLVSSVVKDTDEPGRDVMGIPMPLAHTTERRVAILHPQGINDGSTELIEMREIQGQHFGPRCVAPNLGYLSLRYPVQGLSSYAQELQERGVEFYSAPATLAIEPYGDTESFSIRSPDGAILEFFEIK
jgi:catechol 2,3-dioxygenase-like lactoylglutathione lyase family enzyme